MNEKAASWALVLDDEQTITELLDITLAEMGFSVQVAHDLRGAREALELHSYALCLTDLRLPDGSGLDFVRHIHRHAPQVPVAVITAYSSTEGAVEAMQAGAFDFMTKPIDLKRLRRLVEQARALAVLTPDGANNGIERLVGDSEAMRALRQQIQLLARSNAPVFLTGESGTGKELSARAIHDAGPRRDKPFIAVNCAAIPEGLLESELFGSEKGAFTGANQKREGLFLAADSGTLFLDEIGDVPMAMQVKLLRALQERSIRPIGASSEVPVDIRLITATHRNLQEMVHAGTFRADLYYRIHVVPLQIPPLRQRQGDIPLLVAALLRKIAQRQGKAPPSMEAGALHWLAQQPFPGNVRELENLLERAFALHAGAEITLQDLSAEGTIRPAQMPSMARLSPLAERLQSAEQEFLRAQLAAARNDVTICAQNLGIGQRSLALRLQLCEKRGPHADNT
ncbi:sigma-54-dependent Fis family transcriptional regulator [Acidithiobacillus sp. CV18-2]|uniref:Sigma-54-dependent Fis family transcriptional regulator n=1 Tax=Igneacidithiobacillus copahuensis TaxID=2724909 RepID=A0AAE2YPG1_9PROT|nr:sigma-54 dependent transcriptional regulator [Igneacidithiobacillus copahuensis]MBU2754470.1 sigma-54-dependent Fis family transcriptional regulator [Acidithiobacillus sp. CV18-3]MBU2756775.1 sigma-54-dependent Fis family transcriptional regulator [Acidithiobacillus sp. BN09-2]MBU2778342.1 sigma-54-dependent Fis family transcriptional regulator [Acidithiobacillus sp. CV18-2]MBU2797613.1 sigma-54-dependent Fis family transcriptional regulator [Acidithiobacillus sp. VAN18-2]MBU2797942.1 sigma